ncbi:MAG: Uma2 family endonuclease [Cyanobacteria bacterium J06560_6]
MVTTQADEALQAKSIELCEIQGQLTQLVLLPNISWQTYQAMLDDMGSHRAARVAYDDGVMTIKRPSELHEFLNRLLAYIVRTIAVELDLLCTDVGSMTLQREDLQKGAEPDTGFYIQNAISEPDAASRIPTNLPPDLLVEVDITSPSTRRMSIYRALGISEVWQYTKRDSVVIHHLTPRDYVEASVSIAFPQLTATQLNQFLNDYKDDRQLNRDIRSWVQSLKQK